MQGQSDDKILAHVQSSIGVWKILCQIFFNTYGILYWCHEIYMIKKIIFYHVLVLAANKVKVPMALSGVENSSLWPVEADRRAIKCWLSSSSRRHSDMSARTSPNYTFLVGVLAFLCYIEFLSWRGKALVLFLAWVLAGGHYTIYLAHHTLGRFLSSLCTGNYK